MQDWKETPETWTCKVKDFVGWDNVHISIDKKLSKTSEEAQGLMTYVVNHMPIPTGKTPTSSYGFEIEASAFTLYVTWWRDGDEHLLEITPGRKKTEAEIFATIPEDSLPMN